MHRAILRRRNCYFEAMLNSQFLEASQKIVTINVATGSTVCTTVLVMRYLYTANIRIMCSSFWLRQTC